MRCEACQGTGIKSHAPTLQFEQRAWGAISTWAPVPCGECNGSGLSHCCDGLREQPKEKVRST